MPTPDTDPSRRARPVVVLVGPPGAGKTTVGTILAHRLAVPFLDTDDAVEAATGQTVPELFATRGEAGFRAVEREVVTRALEEFAGVVALGGGSVLDPATRADLAAVPVVLLDVTAEAALPRTATSAPRPLLATEPAGRLARLLAERGPLYREVADVVVDTTGRSPQDVAEALLARLGVAATEHRTASPTRIRVKGPSPYDVVVGRGVADEVAALVGPDSGQVLVLHAAATAGLAQVLASRLGADRAVHLHELPDAEDAKTVQALAAVWDVLGDLRLGRADTVVAVGGGAVTDAGGFAAATWLRGVRLVNVPTTLLGMVDAAVGGKTGINTAAGKNLVGAFHPPAGVVCDLDALATLPAADLRAGLAEVVKCGFIADPVILELVEADGGAAAAQDPGSPVLRELVERAVAVKARVVGEDLRESGLREILNYGHTFAHAVERREGYRVRHGDAVAVGMVFAAELAAAAGVLDPGTVERHRAVLTALGLPTGYPAGHWAEVSDAMARDKKVRAATLRFIVLEDVARPTVLRGPRPEHLEAAYAAVSE